MHLWVLSSGVIFDHRAQKTHVSKVEEEDWTGDKVENPWCPFTTSCLIICRHTLGLYPFGNSNCPKNQENPDQKFRFVIPEKFSTDFYLNLWNDIFLKSWVNLWGFSGQIYITQLDKSQIITNLDLMSNEMLPYKLSHNRFCYINRQFFSAFGNY